MSAEAGHRYFVHSDEGMQPWNPHDPADIPVADCGYFGGVFTEFERHWEGDPLTVYLTKDTTSLPTYGPDVVSLLLNEEWFRTPAYSGEILAVMRNLPGEPWFPWSTVMPPRAGAGYALANHCRVLIERRRSMRDGERLRRERGWAHVTTANTIDVPLGYYRQPKREILPIEERGSDVYFGGSLAHDLDRKERWKQIAKRTVGNPKTIYRRSMVSAVRAVQERHPEIRATLTITGEFTQLGGSEVSDYAADMMNARVALVPRGTAAESYRLFEAWRYGSIVICEPLPPRPFLQGAPVITLDSWQDLEGALLSLLADTGRQRELHEASLRWWRDVCSEPAVGRRLAAQLGALRAATAG
jgi:hypothetical protein